MPDKEVKEYNSYVARLVVFWNALRELKKKALPRNDLPAELREILARKAGELPVNSLAFVETIRPYPDLLGCVFCDEDGAGYILYPRTKEDWLRVRETQKYFHKEGFRRIDFNGQQV